MYPTMFLLTPMTPGNPSAEETLPDVTRTSWRESLCFPISKLSFFDLNNDKQTREDFPDASFHVIFFLPLQDLKHLADGEFETAFDKPEEGPNRMMVCVYISVCIYTSVQYTPHNPPPPPPPFSPTIPCLREYGVGSWSAYSTAYSIWPVTSSQSPISISLFSLQRNVAKET